MALAERCSPKYAPDLEGVVAKHAYALYVGALHFGRLDEWRRAKIDELMREPS